MSIFDKLSEKVSELYKHFGYDEFEEISKLIEETEAEHKKECEKIPYNCNTLCTMDRDMKMIKIESQYYKPYEKVVKRHELQLKNCPKICPEYKEV